MKSLSCTGWIILLRYEKLKYNSAQVHQKMHWTFVSRNKKNPSRTHITYHHRIFVMQLLFYQELLKNNDSCSTQHYEPFWIKRCRKLLIIFSLAISGKIQRFLGLRIQFQFFGKGICQCFWSLSTLFFICIIFKKESLGETGGRPGETGAPLSNLQLVPGRDNICDVGL